MAIRLRVVDGMPVALCAARSMPQDGDIYLDDGWHQALGAKFALDLNSMYDLDIPHNASPAALEAIKREEGNNPNRAWWDRTYGGNE